jgi:predicted dienelactone hydrolase
MPAAGLLVILLAACSDHGGGAQEDAADADAVEDGAGADVAREDGEIDLPADEIPVDPREDLSDEADADGGDDIADADVEEEFPEPTYPPFVWGPHSVGVRTMQAYDAELSKQIEMKVWYPAPTPPSGSTPVTYMLVMRGRAYEDLAVDPSGAPYPLILFSHGNKGINFQSYSFTEYLASHGFFVVAPNHEGNTIFDNPSDEQMAQIALERPYDVAFAYDTVVAAAYNPSDPFHGMVDDWTVGMSGHSFGGYTALVVAGATVDVDAARARCEAGSESDIFCPYIGFWPPGTVLSRPPQLWVVGAAVALAPGGYAAFGDEGLAGVGIPMMIFGGTLDEWTPLEIEIRPIYDGLTSDATRIEIEQAGHMSFTDICRIPGSMLIPDLADMCDPSVYIDIDRAFEITDTFATAFFRYRLKGETAMAPYLEADFAALYPEVAFASK